MSNPSYYVGIAEPGNVIASSTSTALSFTGLTANTSYSMYVIGIYANNTVTSIGTYSFTTSGNYQFYLNNSTSLIAYYTFETTDVNGVYLKNYVTNNYDASMVNSASIISSSGNYKVGTSALNLNGSSQYASISPNAFYLGSSGISVSYWLRSNSSAFTSRSFAFSNGYLNNTVLMETAWNTTTPGSILIDIGNSGGTEFVGATNYVSNNNTWMHVVWTINTNGTNLFYVNGVLNNTYTGIAYPTSIQRNLLFIGQGEQLASTPYFIGQIDDFRVYNSLLSANDAAQLYNYTGSTFSNYYPLSPSWTPAYSNLVAYFMLDETTGATLVKEQISGYNGTAVGGTTFGSAGIVGNCGTFDGSTGYINVPYQVMNNLSTGTIMCWVYVTNLTSSFIFVKQKDGANTYGVLSIGSLSSTGGGVQAGTAGYVYWHGKNSQAIAAAVSNSAISASVWTHIAVTFSTTYTNIYINGVLSSTTSTDMSIPNDTTPTATTIGGWYSGSSLAAKYTGKIDELSVWNTVLNPSQVFQIYKTQLYGPDTFYLNTSPYLITYYRFETADVNGTSLTNYVNDTADATLTSATISSTVGNYKIGSSALALTLQYATINRTFTTAQTFSSGVTFACWFSTPATNGYQRIFDFGVSGTSGIAMYTDSATGKLGIYIPSTTVSATLTGTVVTDGVWRHAVWTINTSGLSTVYINGASVLTVSSTFPSLTMTSNFIGKSNNPGDANFTGKIDEFRVYNCVLTANDVAQLYAYSGSNPTTSYYPLSTTWTPYYGNLLAYYMLDDAVSSTTVKDQINAYTATVVGAVTFGNTGKLSTCAFFNNLSSSTGYLTLPSLTLTSSNMSFSFWANIPSITGNAETFIELGNSTSDHIRIFLSSTNYLVGTVNSSDSNLFLINPYFNQWIHIVVTISSGTNWTVYLNGTSMATVTKTAFTLNTKTLNNIGRSPSYSANPYYYGYLDDFAIWNTALSAAAVNGIYNTQKLAIYNDKLYTVPRQGINFELMFGSSTLPTVDNFGSTLTSTGSPTMVNDANRGNVLYCNASQYITTTINTGTGSFSRCFWYNPVALVSNNNNLLSSTNCVIWYNGTVYVNVRFNYASGTALTLADTVNRGTGTWTHYVVTYDSTLLTGSLYVNGSLITSGSVTFSETGTLNINSYGTGTIGNAYYDNIHLYNRALTAAEVTSMYNYELDNPTDSNALVVSSTSFTATGTYTSTTIGSYTVVTFTSGSGTITVTGASTLNVLVVAGGGGGGVNLGSGGGGGGVINNAAYSITSGSPVSLSVGTGGTSATTSTGQGTNGGNSTFGTLTAIGGGAGCGQSAAFSGGKVPQSGGSGGGQTRNSATIGQGTAGQGNAGGTYTDYACGGGGGAGGAGGNAAPSSGNGYAGGSGGAGYLYSITSQYYGGGGGGSSQGTPSVFGNSPAASGGTGGGGASSNYSSSTTTIAAVSGTNGLGGGGGGSNTVPGTTGGNGVVIVAFLTSTGVAIPSAPTSVSAAVASSTSVTVSFTAPLGTVTSYTVTSSPGSIVATGTSSPITVTGLTASTAYTFTVTASNAAGTSPASAASASVTTSATYPTPTLQFDATVNVTTSGTAVTSWKDITGTYNATQATVSQQPTLTANYMNSKNGVVFSGPTAGQLLTVSGMPFTTTNTMVIFAVLNISSNPQMQNFCSTGGGNWAAGYTHNVMVSNGFQLSLNPYVDFKPTGSVPFNTPFILMYYYSFNSGTTGLEFLRLNGTSSNKNTPSTQSYNIQLNQLDIGGWSGGGRTINGGICDLLFYNYAMTQTQVQSVESYLSTKWNIAISQGAL